MMRSLWSQSVILTVEIDDTGEVRGIAYIHCICQSLHAGLGLVLARLQIFIDDIICIVGSNEALDGQAHRMTEQSGTDIPEIA